jgi:hypothetical protein
VETVVDLNQILLRFIERKLAAYSPPKSPREGRPFKAAFEASLWALTALPLDQQAEKVGMSYTVLKATRSKDWFKDLVRDHVREFGVEAFAEMFSITLDRYEVVHRSVKKDEPCQVPTVRIVTGMLSREGFMGVLAALRESFIGWGDLRQRLQEDPRFKSDHHSAMVLNLLYREFVPAMLAIARQHFRYPMAEVERLKDELLDRLLEAFGRDLVTLSRSGKATDSEMVSYVRDVFQLAIAAHEEPIPKLPKTVAL